MQQTEDTEQKGRYDDYADRLQKELQSQGVVLIVIGGEKGSGFSIAATPAVVVDMPSVLHEIACMMDRKMSDHPNGRIGFMLEVIEKQKKQGEGSHQ